MVFARYLPLCLCVLVCLTASQAGVRSDGREHGFESVDEDTFDKNARASLTVTSPVTSGRPFVRSISRSVSRSQ